MQQDLFPADFVEEVSGKSPAAHEPQSAAAPARWLHPASVLLDIEMPHLVLSSALDRGDDEAIWDCHAKAADPQLCSDWLAGLAGTLTRSSSHPKDPCRRTEWRSSLVAAPFLMAQPAAAARTASAPASDLGHTIYAQWRNWISGPQEVAVISDGVSYADICRWSPVTQREYLARLTRQALGSPVPRMHAAADVPESFPHLYFLVGSVTRWLAFPELPDRHAPGPALWELRQRVAGFLGCHYGQQIQPLDVEAPMLFAEAVMAGMLMWIRELARQDLVASWRAEPGGRDVVLLELTSSLAGCEQVRIPLRDHQLGRGGVELLLVELEQLFGRSQSRGGRAVA